MSTLIIEKPNKSAVLKHKLTSAVRDYAANEPRSKQTSIGASEIGSPCDRQLAFKALGYAENRNDDPWARIIGTSVHFYLERVFESQNNDVFHPDGKPWLIETRVEIGPGVKGTADLYDVEERCVIDHKVPADSTMEKVRRGQISETYKTQLQCYGYGFAQLGYDVESVALAFWPRGKGAWLGGLEVVVYDYDETVAKQALARWYGIVNAAIALDLENYPERAKLLATADAPCKWCPFFDVTGRGEGATCRGHKKP